MTPLAFQVSPGIKLHLLQFLPSVDTVFVFGEDPGHMEIIAQCIKRGEAVNERVGEMANAKVDLFALARQTDPTSVLNNILQDVYTRFMQVNNNRNPLHAEIRCISP